MYIIQFIRGFCMALADSVPGVSGGTVAFLLGFYDQFIDSIDDLITGNMEKKKTAFFFLLKLGIGWVTGMILAILILANVFESHIYAISSLFIGFIIFAIPIVVREEIDTLKGKYAYLPFILVGVIEFAIFVNMGIPYYTGTKLPFVASIVIGTIQLGSTVDYAILMTTRYKRERNHGANKHDAITTAHRVSAQSIMVSALSFFAATIGVGLFSNIDMISSLCILMARGALISMVVVIFVLPSMFMSGTKYFAAETV